MAGSHVATIPFKVIEQLVKHHKHATVTDAEQRFIYVSPDNATATCANVSDVIGMRYGELCDDAWLKKALHEVGEPYPLMIEVVHDLKLVGKDGAGLLMLDRELGARQPPP